MSKYSFELKLQVVRDYLDGIGGYKALAQKYHIQCESSVKEWIRNYQAQGVNGLRPQSSHKCYSLEFKLEVLKYKQTASYQETASHFGLSSSGMVANWQKKYDNEGIDGLKRSNGRPPSVSKKIKNKIEETSEKPIVSDKERIQQLEEEVEYLQTEVAVLKKVRAFLRKEENEKSQNSKGQNNSKL